MKIRSMRIQNFRSFADQTIEFERYAAFVGANGAGKSTILCALNIFFREGGNSPTDVSVLDEEDFHLRDTSKPIVISVTFSDLDDGAVADFAEYVRQGELVISATASFDSASKRATVKQYGQRRVIEAFANYFEQDKARAKASDLKEEFLKLKVQFPGLDSSNTTKEGMKAALRAFEEENPDKCKLLPSEDQFYGFSGGADRLNKYVQWVYVPAVKDVTQENTETKNSALGSLLKRTVRLKVDFDSQMEAIRDEARTKYHQAMQEHQGALDEISTSLSTRLQEWCHPDATARLEWIEDERRSVVVEEPTARLLAKEGTFEGALARFGHGYQRSYLVALLQELASLNQQNASTLILGIEEPELYQHPPQARHLSEVLQKLSNNNAQVFVTTHSPHFVSGRHFENAFVVRRNSEPKLSRVFSAKAEEVALLVSKATGKPQIPPDAEFARLEQALNPQINEMFFCSRVIFVEGIEDVAYLTSWLMLSGRWEAFRRAGAHIVAVGGKSNMVRPLVLASLFDIPAFAIFDSDGDEKDPNRRAEHESDNLAILSTLGATNPAAFPADVVIQKRYVQWPNNIAVELRADVPPHEWDKAFGAARKALGNPPGDFSKNPILVGALLTKLSAAGQVPESLSKACGVIELFLLDNS